VFIFLLPHVLTNSLPVHVLTLNLALHWEEPEDVMNRVMMTALIAGGLMLVNSPEAAAHKEVRHTYQTPAYYHYDYRANVRRSQHMPRWLKRDDSFRRWYKHTRLKRNRYLAWNHLFDIYRWERHREYRYDRRYRDHDRYRYRDDRHGHREESRRGR